MTQFDLTDDQLQIQEMAKKFTADAITPFAGEWDEKHIFPRDTIKSAADAAWWTITTMSTVGYGDTYPITPEGRILAAVVMVFGVALFGTLSGLTASWFLGEDRTQYREQLERLATELRAIRARLDERGPQVPAEQRQLDHSRGG